MRAKQTGSLLRLLFVLMLFAVVPVTVSAQSSSTNYSVDEYYFGVGGELESTSASFQARSALGALGVGRSSSTLYDAEAGFITENEPFLEMVVSGANVDLGTLTPAGPSYGAAQAGGCSCSFHVRTYLSSQYVVVSVSDPPTNESGVSLAAKSTLGAPSMATNVEEFGINLVANTVPGVLGANPENIPDNSFADGTASTGYNTPDQYKYAKGDTIAESAATANTQAVGHTNYTISYIAKNNGVTPAGLYVMDHTIVVVATF
jgi:hypothetical protein